MVLARKNRIVLIRHIENTFADISTIPINENSISVKYSEAKPYFVTPHPAFDSDTDVYLFPFLLNSDGSPWQEANLFLFSSTRDHKKGYSNSDIVRQKARLLLSYKMFCEKNNIDLMNFSGRQPRRPTYRYFIELMQQLNNGEIKRNTVNLKTKVVYDFYKYQSQQPNSLIELERVDSVKTLKIFFSNSHGQSYSANIEKRGQSVSVSRQATPVPIGFTREYGEDLRPLREPELEILLDILQSDKFKVDERLIHYIAMHTGARKQTILTMRIKHMKEFSLEKLLDDGTYKLNAGPGTGIDTKFNKEQSIYFPKSLADQIQVFVNSPKARIRREKFIAKNGEILSENDMYVFLSPEGEPHYMAKNDPRYKTTTSRPQGRNTYYIKKKLLRHTDTKFPSNFTFHWLRATFALRYYRWLQPLFAKGYATDSDIISMVQKRLHHSDRTTTEHYLKLFDSIDDRLEAQTIYEKRALDLYGDEFEGKL